MAGGIPGEEHAVLGGGAEAVREPVALVADGRRPVAGDEVLRRLLDVVARRVGADPDPRVAGRGTLQP